MKKIIMSLMLLTGITAEVSATIDNAKMREAISLIRDGIKECLKNKNSDQCKAIDKRGRDLEASMSQEERDALHAIMLATGFQSKPGSEAEASKRMDQFLREQARKYNNWFQNLTDTKLKRTGALGAAAALAALTTYGISYYNTPVEDTNVQPGETPKSRTSRALTNMTSKLKNPFVLVALGAATVGGAYWVSKA